MVHVKHAHLIQEWLVIVNTVSNQFAFLIRKICQMEHVKIVQILQEDKKLEENVGLLVATSENNLLLMVNAKNVTIMKDLQAMVVDALSLLVTIDKNF